MLSTKDAKTSSSMWKVEIVSSQIVHNNIYSRHD